MIVQRGFRKPPSYHIDRLRNAPNGHLFDVITNGFGAMTDYASRVSPRDRWAIIAYIRALQLSQNARIEDVPENERGRMGQSPTTLGAHTEAGREGTPPVGERREQPSEVRPGERPGARR
jgi:hypothetical protein